MKLIKNNIQKIFALCKKYKKSINKHPFVSIKTSVRFNQDVRSFQSKREYVF